MSAERNFQTLYVQGRGALRQELKASKAVREGRAGRVPVSQLPPRSGRSWLYGHHVSARPAEPADRAIPGHWESDVLIGKARHSGLITLVERASRYTLLRRLPDRSDSATVVDVLIEMAAGLSDGLLRILTCETDSDMTDRARVTLANDAEVFFCDPDAPWRPGTNENTTYLVRDLLGGKEADYNDYTDADIAEAQRLLNIRPRETLAWKNPAQHLSGPLGALAG